MTTAEKKVMIWRIPQFNGSLLKSPVWEGHQRGTNWLAVIDVDGTCPGGLSRRFMPRGKGESLYLIEQLALFDAVEFGADYTTSVGRKKPNRAYGFVAAITDLEVVVQQCESGSEACIAARIARTSPDDRRRALEEQKAALLRKTAELDEEIAKL